MADRSIGAGLYPWVRDMLGVLITGAILSALQALSPHYEERLGWLGDALAWRWTPTLVFLSLAVIVIWVRRSRQASGPVRYEPDSLIGLAVESDGISWVFDGWARWNEFSATPVMRTECIEHGVQLAHLTTGKGELLQPLHKAGRFSGARKLYCVGPEGHSGHAIRPAHSKDMNTARLRAEARMIEKIRRARQSETGTSGSPPPATP